jgi:bifunctional non-homologous end joining protein LigD
VKNAAPARVFPEPLLELDGVDYRPLHLRDRKERLARLIDRRLTGIAMVDHTDARGEPVFEQACRMGLEGIVSKRLSKPYQSGRSGYWLKVKNPDSPAMVRHREGNW